MTLFTDSPYEKMHGLPLSGAVPLYRILYQKVRKRQTAGTLKGGFFIDFTYLSNR